MAFMAGQGYPIIQPGPVPAALLAHARRAVDACQVLALRLRVASTASVAERTTHAPVVRRAPTPRGASVALPASRR
jgi:hypothetical protein